MASLSFQSSLAIGKTLEDYIAELLGCSTATKEQQQAGIDLIAPNGVTIECKLDKRGKRSGNFYAELTTGKKPGCLFTCTAEIVLICFGEPGNFPLYATDTSRFVASYVKFTQKMLKIVECKNPGGYGSTGMLVPVRMMSDFCDIISTEAQLIEYVKTKRYQSFRKSA